MPSWPSESVERLGLAGVEADRRTGRSTSRDGDHRGRLAAVQPLEPHAGDRDAVADLAPRGDLQRDEAGDRDQRR